MRWSAWIITAVSLAGLGLACDKNDDIPPEVIKARQDEQQKRLAAAATKPAPTTQELLTGSKKSLVLGAFPLTLQVPQNWGLQSSADGGVIEVTGPASSGEIHIQLVQQGLFDDNHFIEKFKAAAQKELDAKPHPLNLLESHKLGTATVVEQQMITTPFVNGKLPAEIWGDVELNPETKTVTRAVLNPQNLKCTITLFEPGEKGKLLVRALILNIRVSEFERDREFLEQLFKSLKYQE